MTCAFEHDDAAYILGALSPAERATYERHLATCAHCRDSVAELAVLPELLGRLDSAALAALIDPPSPSLPAEPSPGPVSGPPESVVRRPSLSAESSAESSSGPVSGPPESAVRRPSSSSAGPSPGASASSVDAAPVSAGRSARDRTAGPRGARRGARVRLMTAVLAAAALAMIASLGTAFWITGRAVPPPPPMSRTVAMRPLDEVPITAELTLTSAADGTKINLTCRYARSAEYTHAYTVRLMAYGPDNQAEEVGSWVATPGGTFAMSGATHFTQGSLSRLELVRADGTKLLAYDVP